MTRRVRVREQAERDVDEIAATIARASLEAGIRFYDAVQQTFDLLAEYPNIGTRRAPPTRRSRSCGR